MVSTRIQEEDHFQKLLRLLDLEAEAEKQVAQREMERRLRSSAASTDLPDGNSLVNLVIREQDTGMGGHILLTLGKRNQQLALPWTRLRSGSPVILTEEGAGGLRSWRGIVTRLQGESIQVALPEWPETSTDRPIFRLDRSTDEVSRQRQRQAVESVRRTHDSRLGVLRDVLLAKQPPFFAPDAARPDLTAAGIASLNPSQRAAIQFVFTARDVAIIHGPPGTGKTTTLVALIRQIIRRGETVLAVAPSNLAVDNLLERLIAPDEDGGPPLKALRLGHPARVLPELRRHTLDELVETHPDVRLAHQWAREADQLRGQASRFTRARPEPGSRQALRKEARELIADARKLEDQVVGRLLDAAQVVCATNTGLDRAMLGQRTFDWCIMDEVSQSTEPAAWIPIQFARRLVLAGDPYQLPPTILSTEAAAQGFAVSLMERLMQQLGPGIANQLTVQYRMHTEIMTFSSREFYADSLLADPRVAGHLLRDLPGVADMPLTRSAVTFIDTAGASYDEQIEPDGESRFNLQEALLVAQTVQRLLDAGVPPSGLAVISPYSAQVRLLREQIQPPDLEVDSVDGFQGREKEAVIVSLVRSNRDNDIGFLEDVRRMNVALTRARRKLIVIGDSATITTHPFYQRMVDYFDAIGAYHSVWEM